MKALAKLKDDARKYEQREEWEKAIEAYVQVLKTTEGTGEAEAELPLFNRVGDLFVRLGRPIDAVTYYESAADHYAEAGLFNNAIALCNKALRYLPSRLELLRKLGQFSAAQGFITDARRWYLEYAERQLKQGAIEEAFTALQDFAQVHEDAEIRELLGRYLYAHNRPAEAIAALSRARELRVQAGETDVAQRLAQEILSLDPAAKIDGSVSAPPPVASAPPPPVAQAVAPPPPPPAVEAPHPRAWHPGMDSDLPGLPEEPAVPPESELPEEEDDFSDEPITSDVEVFADSAPETVDALATFDGGGDDSTAGLESGLIDLDSIPDINVPFDLATTSLSLGGDVPVVQSAEGLFDLPFMSSGEPSESVVDSSLFSDAFSGFDEFSIEEKTDQPAIDSPSFIESEVGFEADVDFTAPPAREVKSVEIERDSMPFDFEYEAPAVPQPPTSSVEQSPAPQEPQDEEWVVEGLEQDPEPVSFSEMLAEEESANAAATIESEAVAAFDDFEFETPKEAPADDFEFAQPAEVAEPKVSRFSFEVVTYPGIEEEELGVAEEPAAEMIEQRVDHSEVAEELLEPETIDAAEEFFAHAIADTDDVEFDETVLEEPLPGLPAEEAFEELFAEEAPGEATAEAAYASESLAEAEPVAEVEAALAEPAEEEPVPQHEPIPYWVPPTPPADVEPVVPAPEPALLDGAVELTRIRRLILGGDAFGAVHELEALHPKLAASGQILEAWEATNVLLNLDSNNQRVLQQRLEYAALSGDHDLSLQSYLDFGRYLQRTGAEAKARVIFQRVLDLDPRNAEANAFMKAVAPPKVTTGYVDLLALLEEEEQSENTRFMVAEKPPTGDEERDFADMLTQFKQKVAENVSLNESGAHYDLGLAFKEMGLIDEAIAEFQVALKGGEERLKVYEELGQCFLLKQQYTVAVTVLNRALTLPVKDDSDLLGVYYSLGRSYEELGRPGEARSAYERVVGFDIGFRDASERLARL